MSSLLHYYRVADLHVNPALQKKANDVGFKMVSSEICYNIQATAALDAEETKKLEYLLRETFEPEKFGSKSFLSGKVVEVAPRQQFTSAWSTNAVSICHSISLEKIVRIEKSRRYQVETSTDSLKSFAKLVHDRMTECEYPSGISTFQEHQEPEGWTRVPVMAQGAKALEELSKQKGLGYDEQDIAYYLRVFRDELKRDPTTVECFDLAQGNSEHSRHWFFGGKVVIDGEDMPLTLFQWVKRPLKERISNSVIGFHDNSSALRGYAHTAFLPSGSVAQPSAFKEVTRDFDITLTVETHNFPCGIAPFPGAETGAGGRIRDGESTGKGSLVVAAVAGYATGNLHIPGYKMPWEFEDFKYPSNMAPPLQVLIDCSNGASDYGNKFGEPLICGWTRSCGMRLPSGERFEWVKPIMLSGGLGQMDHGHLVKEDPQAGQLVVKIGGPAYRIGVGGGAASSMVAGDNQEELDFNAVQRGDAEMQQKVNRVVRACVELGPKNPILSIHDQGAGGSGNVLKEISEPAGAVIDLRKMHVGDPSMSFLELWTAEFQENNALLLGKENEAMFDQICKREKVPYAVLGTITGDGQVVVKDSRDGSTPVDLPLEKVLGKMPQKVFPMQRIYKQTPRALDLPPSLTVQVALETGVLRLLSVCSKRFLTNKVDRSVTGQIAQQQCVGPLQTPLADFACIAQSPLSMSGAMSGGATAIGEQPLKGLPGDPESCISMARLAVAEALTNLAWIRIPTLDSIKASGNWMWAAKLPGEGPKMYDIAEALSNIMVELGIAIDGGKDSLSMAARVPLGNGQVETAKSPGQFVLTVYAPVPDVRIKATPDLKTHGDGVLLFVDLGAGPPVLGGSAPSQVFGQLGFGKSPQVDAKALKAAFNATQRLLSGGLILAGHDRSDGGLLTAVLEMAFAGRVGVELKLDDASPGSYMEKLFNEAPGLVYEVRRSDLAAVLRVFEGEGVAVQEIGATRKDLRAVVHVGKECVLDGDVAALHCIWEATSFQLERQQCDVPCVEQEEAGFKNRRVPPYKLTYTPEPTADAVLNGGRKHRVAIVRQEGSNGDREMAAAFHMAGFEAWDVHMTDLLEGRTSLESFRGAAFVGGFSYADTLDSAKGWAGSVLFSAKLEAQFKAFRDRPDSFALGICNGCQLLALLGWAPGASSGGVLPLEQQPRFVHNRSGRFESRFTTVRVDASAASKVWLKGMEGTQMGVWVNHGEGRCHFPDASVFERVKKEQLIPMRYIDDDGNATETYPFNPNGSPEGIVGLCSSDGRILSIMPHPERLASWPWQWPYAPQEWMEGSKRLRCSPWLKMFQNVREWCDSK